MPPLYARPRHAAPRDHGKVRAALVPAVLLASTGTALGGLAANASADDRVVHVSTAASSTSLAGASAERANEVAQAALRADRARATEQVRAAQQAVAQQAADKAASDKAAADAASAATAKQAADAAAAEAAAEAAKPKYVRPDVGPLSSGFGYRWGRLHAGIDLAGPYGSAVVAVADGVVESTQWEGGYGNCVRIKHPDGTETLYGHLSAFVARPGQVVQAGQQIAREGNTGHSTGPHLHFEVHTSVGGTPINPIPWLTAHGIAV